jgi:hypothetical protein
MSRGQKGKGGKRTILELDSAQLNGTIKFPRLQAQADYHIEQKEITKSDGTKVFKKTTTLNDEKIADTCTQIFQESTLAKDINYVELRDKAIEDLSKDFDKHNLRVTSKTTIKEENEITKRQEIAIAQWIRNYIQNNIDLAFEVDYDTFISLTGIKTAERVGVALKLLTEVQGKASYKYKIPEINEDFTEISYELAQVYAVPKIGLLLDEEMGTQYQTIEDYANSPVPNKRKHIKGIRFELSPSYLSAVLGLGRDYTASARKDRLKFNSSYSYRFDMLIRSIEKVQHIKKYNYFPIEKIQNKFGTNFAEYKHFKNRVLNPVIKDMNTYSPDLYVELVEYKSGKEIIAVSFKISRKHNEDRRLKFGVDKTAYYIASRLFYFSNEKIDNLLGFAHHVEKSFNSLDLIMYGSRYIAEWREEADMAILAEDEILQLIDNNRSFFMQKGIEYDEKRMCIVENFVEKSEIGDDKMIKKIIKKADYKIENPMSSLRYMKEIIESDGVLEQSIIDYIPFKVAHIDLGWLNIKIPEDFIKHQRYIIQTVKEKKLDFFRFENDLHEQLFKTNMVRENFKELYDDYRKSINKLTENT